METTQNIFPCFFCLTKVKIVSPSESSKYSEIDNDKPVWLCLKRIINFLKINPFENQAKLGVDTMDYVVMLCGRCGSAATKLSHICEELELLQMKANYLSGLISSLILIEANDAVETRSCLEDNLRRKIKEKCTKLTKLQLPRVVLVKPQIIMETCSFNIENKIEILSSDEDSIDLTEEFKAIPVESNDLTNYELLPALEVESPCEQNDYQCSICSESFSRIGFLQTHSSEQHPDQYFNSSKFPNLSHEQFRKCCQELLNREFSLLIQKQHNNDIIYACHYCSHSLPELQTARNHLITNHYESLQKELENLQQQKTLKHLPSETESPSEKCIDQVLTTKSIEVVSTNTVSNSVSVSSKHFRIFVCDACNKEFCTQTAFKVHKAQLHMSQIFLSCKRKELLEDQFEKYCYVLLHNETTLFKRFKNPKGRCIYQCFLCVKIVSGFHPAKIHLLAAHRQDMARKLKSIQNTTTPDKLHLQFLKIIQQKPRKSICLSQLSKQNCKEITKKQEHNLVSYRQCISCQFECRAKSLRAHCARCHPEIFFTGIKLSNVSEENFKLYCKILIQRESNVGLRFEFVNNRRKYNYNCIYCSNKPSDLSQMKAHLVTVHHEQLAEKLIDLQKTVNIEDVPGSFGRFALCSICHKLFDKSDSLERHQEQSHPEQLFLHFKSMQLSQEQFRNICIKTINVEIASFEIRVAKNKQMVYTCSYCHRTSRGKQAASLHVVTAHRSIIEKKLQVLQNVELENNGNDEVGGILRQYLQS